MSHHDRRRGIPQVIREKPLQSGKFAGILLTIVLGVAGFFRIIDASSVIDGPALGDGQFLALILIPLLSLGMVCVVFLESLVTAVRILRSEHSLREQVSGRFGYVALRVAEAGLAVLGVTIMFTVLPVLFAESTPAPAGVGAMLVLMVVGLGILFVSFIRSSAELFVYPSSRNSA